MSVGRGNVSISGPINVHLTRGCLPPSDVNGDRGWHLLRHLLPISVWPGARTWGAGARLVRASHVTPLLLSPEQGRPGEREGDAGHWWITHWHWHRIPGAGASSCQSQIWADCATTTNTAHLLWVLMQLVITGWCAFIHPLLCWRLCSMSNMTRGTKNDARTDNDSWSTHFSSPGCPGPTHPVLSGDKVCAVRTEDGEWKLSEWITE